MARYEVRSVTVVCDFCGTTVPEDVVDDSDWCLFTPPFRRGESEGQEDVCPDCSEYLCGEVGALRERMRRKEAKHGD